jgi:hypothetical protein
VSWPDAFVAATAILCLTTIWGVRSLCRALKAGAKTLSDAEPKTGAGKAGGS